jgi:hypothetical protein
MAVKKKSSDNDAIEEVLVDEKTTEKAKEKKVKTEKVQINAKVEIDERKEKYSASVDRDKGAILIGAGLLVIGLLLLISSLFNLSIGNYFWPFIFIIPGALVFFAAISSQRSNGEGLAIVGGLFTMLGLVFLMQSVTGLWATWAYIWALIAPTSIGLSQMFYGNIKNDDTISHTGWNLTKIGLSILAVGFVFFELIIGLSGFGLARLGLPVFPMILILIGGFLLVRSFIRAR